jgi:hypothetical protein
MDSLGICRCCLSENSDSWEPLFDHKDLNYDQMFSQTFGKIVKFILVYLLATLHPYEFRSF